MLNKLLAVVLAFQIVFLPAVAAAGPAIPGMYGSGRSTLPAVSSGQLPVELPGGISSGVQNVVRDTAANKMTIQQSQSKAVIDWQSFNIGKDAWVRFDQQGNKSWIALNRIYDSAPSQIYGKLTADGTVYMINRNGILFGPGSQVNVHTLVASSLRLNMTAEDFLNKSVDLRFLDDGSETGTPGAVSNFGTIRTGDLGSVFLIGPVVENGGTIIAPAGQIGLVAGTDVSLYADQGVDTTRSALVVYLAAGAGEASNFEGGLLETESGLAGMYGREVRQDGIIRAVTAIKRNGQIELLASDRIVTGEGSVTESPVSDSTEKFNSSFEYSGGGITLAGLSVGTPVKVIEHDGTITANSGSITMNASERVYLGTASVVDASGLWNDGSAADLAVTSQLNSIVLRDAFLQKGGVLQGAEITFNPIAGSSIGDMAGALATRDMTARERSTAGGTIVLNASEGDVIVREGATVDFSGGGTRYAGGGIETTKLVSGNKVYDISQASQTIIYDKLLGSEEGVASARFGVSNSFEGLYLGGGTPIKDRVSSFVQGSSAGSATFSARKVVIDGKLDGSVVRGAYQVLSTDPVDSQGNRIRTGLAEPTAGTLVLGNLSPDSAYDKDHGLGDVSIRQEVAPLSADFAADTPLADAITELSGRILNDAELGRIDIYSNRGVVIGEDAAISLRPGATFTVNAARVEHYGSVAAAGGTVSLNAVDGIGNADTGSGIASRVFLADGSRIDVSGERVDNSQGASGGFIFPVNHLAGGTVELLDKTDQGDGLIIQRQAVVDVSGGYSLEAKGAISGGDAGTLKMQGAAVVPDGELRGFALPGKKGGTVALHAGAVSIVAEGATLPDEFAADSALPSDLQGKLLLAANRFDATGFTNFQLQSRTGVEVAEGVSLAPSAVRLAVPSPEESIGGTSLLQNAFLPLGSESGDAVHSPSYLGASSISLGANVGFLGNRMDATGNLRGEIAPDARIEIGSDAFLRTGAGGTVSLAAPGVGISGTIEAPGGQVSVVATRNDVTLRSGAGILADGYNPPQPEVPTLADNAKTPLSGGSVSIDSKLGDLVLESGSTISVRGASPVAAAVQTAEGGAASIVEIAGDSGSISLSYTGTLLDEASMLAVPAGTGVKGGSLSIRERGGEGIRLTEERLQGWSDAGFDALSLTSATSLDFTGSTDVSFGRSLTLDAPRITAQGEGSIRLQAPWITVTDSGIPSSETPAEGTAELTLKGDWIDLTGDVRFTGFGNVTLEALRDIRLSDRKYDYIGYSGRLETASDLTLRAARIYPTTQSSYTVATSGKITTLPGEEPDSSPIYSAGGSLTLQAAGGIEHRGVLAAPFGTLSLTAESGDSASPSRIYLAEGSVTTTAGDGLVKYGYLDSEGGYRIQDKSLAANSLGTLISSAPDKSVSVQGDEIVAMDGARIDVSGGGSVFGYLFQPGVKGTVDPLGVKGVYVIVPDGSVRLPGDSVYLSGGSGIPEGVYSLLPAEYAFLPGAKVVYDLGTSAAAGVSLYTAAGYPVVAGYKTVSGTSIRSEALKGFAVRDASAVLEEGDFSKGVYVAGNAGALSLRADTTLLNGTLSAAALEGYSGGTLTVSGMNIMVRPTGVTLDAGFGFSTPVDPEYRNTLIVDASTLEAAGWRELRFGVLDENPANSTRTVTLDPGTTISAPSVTLAALDEITLEAGSRIEALDEEGRGIAEITTGGTFTVGSGAEVHASDRIALDAGEIDLRGSTPLRVDHGTLALTGGRIVLASDSFATGNPDLAQANPGIYIGSTLWESFSGFEEVALTSRSDILFGGSFDLHGDGSLALDAKRVGMLKPDGNGPATVSIAANSVVFRNSGSKYAGAVASGSDSMTVTADSITAGPGDIAFDGLSSLSFRAAGDFTALGKGSLSTTGNMTVNASRLTAVQYSDEYQSYQVADYRLLAEQGSFSLQGGNGTPGAALSSGGSLEIRAKRIDAAGVIALDGGRVTLASTGTDPGDGIAIRSSALISARGVEAPDGAASSDTGDPAGKVFVSTAGGAISFESGARIDVSAASRGDAGDVSFESAGGEVSLLGNLAGRSASGEGGSFALDAARITDMSSLTGKLAEGGFDGAIDLRARQGGITVGAEDTLRAASVRLAADSGDLVVNGKVDASGISGGRVELFAGNGLLLASVSRIDAHGTGGDGGTVRLASGGTLSMESGSVIDVSGTLSGGTVSFRAPRTETGSAMTLAGTVSGASEIVAEAFRVYQADTIGAAEQAVYLADARAYMADAASKKAALFAGLSAGSATLRFLPGIEVRSAGDMTVTDTWDLTPELDGASAVLPDTGWRFGTEPGVLTLRAGGDLTVNGRIVDHPTPMELLNRTSGLRDSWEINLSAGNDAGAADPLATIAGTGILDLSSPDALIYTENAPIRFSAGNAVEIGGGTNPAYMTNLNQLLNYTVGSYRGGIEGRSDGDIRISGGAVQTATGDIRLETGGDLVLAKEGNFGAIRTTGEHAAVGESNYFTYYYKYWEYAGGGDIHLDVNGAVDGGVDPGAWDTVRTTSGANRQTYWYAAYEGAYGTDKGFRGIGTLAGGTVDVESGGDFYCQAAAFGEGDLRIRSGGNLRGRFLAADGEADFRAGGHFGTFQVNLPDGTLVNSADYQVIEALNADIRVTAQGDIVLGTVVNPTIARNQLQDVYWDLRYGMDSGVTLTARSGEVAISGETSFYTFGTGNDWQGRVLPPVLEVHAAKDITLSGDLALAPSPERSLVLVAGGSIDGETTIVGVSGAEEHGRAVISLPDLDPESVFGGHANVDGDSIPTYYDFFSGQKHAALTASQRGDGPVTIAATSDIRNLQLYTPVRAEIVAGRDIRDIHFVGQNNNDDDVTEIRAGRDITFSSLIGGNNLDTGIQQGGPGSLLVQAGRNIDLGTTRGIQSYGNSYNSSLGTKGSDVYVLAGLKEMVDPQDVEAFFYGEAGIDASADDRGGIWKAGTDYSDLKAEGKTEEAANVLADARSELIEPFADVSKAGPQAEINMVSSQISTNSDKDNIYVAASGVINVGRSTILLDKAAAESSLRNTGIYTAKGGAISIFSGGDLNVNEARVMTFRGGDITAWNDLGNINAGRGSKTAVSADPPRLVSVDPSDPNSPKYLQFNPPAVGSGIRTLTYATGFNEEPPPAGDVYLFAPSGAIDAGEAGIAGNKVVLGATQVFNASNISFTGGSVGVPSASAGISIGAMSGTSSMTDGAKAAEQVASMGGAAQTQLSSKALDDFIARYLDVRVLSFDATEEEEKN